MILSRFSKNCTGIAITSTCKITEIELELVGGHLVVEVEVVTVDEDKVWRVFVDTKTGKVLQAEEKSEN